MRECAVMFVTYTSFRLCLRYYLGYHFADQIYVGAAAGVCVGFAWHSLYMRFCVCSRTTSGYNLSEKICSLALMKWIGLRDYSRVEYAPMEEYSAMYALVDGKKKL